MATKMTKSAVFTAIAKALEKHPEVMTAEVSAEIAVSALTHEIELLEKKSANKKPSKAQKENAELLPKVIEVVRSVGRGTAADIRKACVEAGVLTAEATPQKMTALLNMSEVIKRETEKGKSYFSIAE